MVTTAAQSTTRRAILLTIKKQGEARAEELASILGITPSAIRQHLAALLGEGLVSVREQRGSAGRPKHVYSASTEAEGLFPKTYGELTCELLDYAGAEGPGTVDRLFERRRQRRVAAATARLAGKSFDERVVELARILDEDGYLADTAHGDDGDWRIVEHNCAILEVALRYGQACSSEIGFLRDVMPDAQIERVSHMASGEHHCAYLVRPRDTVARLPGDGALMPGPLAGYRVIELAGLGPAPFGAMMLADMGAEVIRVDRPDAVLPHPPAHPPVEPLSRGRRSIGVDLKHPDGVATLLTLVAGADALIEGFRPGVAERLGIGPDPCLARNPRLVYARMTGWGQDGPNAHLPGHDIDYLALSGTLSAIGRAGEAPVPPLNLVADFGGGGLLLAFGVVCALLEARRSGQGQVIDAAMVDGSALLATMIHGFRAAGWWQDDRGTNLLDTGAWFYEVYETADGGHLAVGALEPKFCAELVRLTGFAEAGAPSQFDQAGWPETKRRLAALFKTRTRDEWCALLEGSEACVAPVLGMGEAPMHPHNAFRGTFTEVAGVVQPAPAPRFSRTPGTIGRPPPHAGEHTDEALRDWGFQQCDIDKLRTAGAIK